MPRQTLTRDSRMFKHLLNDLKFKELDLADFSPEAVTLFLTYLDDKQLGDIEDVMFREVHKLALVFEVDWLKNSCIRWLVRGIRLATSDQRKVFVFDECWYILKKWGKKGMVNLLVSGLGLKDNSSFIASYMSDLQKLETGQIDLLLKLGRSNTDLFLRTVLNNLSGQKDLNDKVKYLLEKTNLAFCCERNEDLYLKVFDTISNLSGISVADLRLTHRLTAETIRLISSRREKRRSGCVVSNFGDYSDLINSCKTLNDILKVISEGRVVSMFVLVELLLSVFYEYTPTRDDTKLFVTNLENNCSEIELKKVSRRYLDIIIDALSYSITEKSHQIITLLKEINENDKLSSYQDNIFRKPDKLLRETPKTENKKVYTFKHPGTTTCPESDSKCGFILKYCGPAGKKTLELCTNSSDYTDTGVHCHALICPRAMFPYVITTGTTRGGARVTVAGQATWWDKWLPGVTDWRAKEVYVAYNLSGYLVAK